MQSSYCPRLSEAKTLLPILRTQLGAAAPRYSLPTGISLDLFPSSRMGSLDTSSSRIEMPTRISR